MTIRYLLVSAVAGALFTGSVAAAQERLNFVGCPVMRDTEMVPCWLAENNGQLYYLGIQLDLQSPFFPPQLLHQALVEGEVTEDTKCGGIVLDPVRVSTLPEIDPTCNTILPAEGHEIKNARRGTGPDPDVLSARNQARARQVPQYDPPFVTKKFSVYFDFDDYYMPTRATRVVTEAMRYATASESTQVEVIAYRGSAQLTNGERLIERDSTLAHRMNMISDALVDIGVPADAVRPSREIRPTEPDGVDDFETRRVDIIVHH